MLPILFVGHGSPMNAIEENSFVGTFRNIAKTFSKPKAILCISAHWYTEGTWVTGMEHPRTIHDFGGFPRALYGITYPAPGNRKLAEKVCKLLEPHVVDVDMAWGLDHGTWTVLRHMYPDADIPVVQLSIDYNKSASEHFALGKKLKSLRTEGVLVMGSGNIVHNLGLIDGANFDKVDYGFKWAKHAQQLINKLIVDQDFAALTEYEKLGSDIAMAIPSPEHYLPLLYILGAKEQDEQIELFNDVLVAGSLSMTGFKIT